MAEEPQSARESESERARGRGAERGKARWRGRDTEGGGGDRKRAGQREIARERGATDAGLPKEVQGLQSRGFQAGGAAV